MYVCIYVRQQSLVKGGEGVLSFWRVVVAATVCFDRRFYEERYLSATYFYSKKKGGF